MKPGLTLKAGCGIGYEFSTLAAERRLCLRRRCVYIRAAVVHGYLRQDVLYRVVGGRRRGAQMGTFDVGHPDVMDFIGPKREAGRLRQFNLSLLMTDEFMQAVKNDDEWLLWRFRWTSNRSDRAISTSNDPEQVLWREWPISTGYVTNDVGEVACKIYKKLPARRLWDMIMASTYDFAEPGFVLVDRVNQMNNNWFDENIRATNPCVTADTWVHTVDGPRQVADLLGPPVRGRRGR